MYSLEEFDENEPELEMLEWGMEREYSADDVEELYYQRARYGGLDPLDTIFVKNVKEGGPAQLAGLNPGDRIISVNGEPVTGKSYPQVINLIQQSSSDLSLLVVPKDEDILQLAYQGSSSAIDSGLGESTGSSVFARSVTLSQPSSYLPSSMESSSRSASSSRDSYPKFSSSSSLDIRHHDNPDQRKTLKTSTSYTSGLSIYREPPNNGNGNNRSEDNMNKAVFLDRKREFESRASQENVNPNTGSKTYSFGLYFPNSKRDGKSNGGENVSRSTVLIRRSRENILQPSDSQDNITRCKSPQTRNVPVEYRHSGTPDQITSQRFRSQESLSHDKDRAHGPGSSIRHSFPDSGVQVVTSPNRRSSETNSPHRVDQGHSDTVKQESYSTRQYVPVISQTSVSRNPKMSASVDSIDPRSNVFHSEQQLRTAYNSHHNEQANQNSPTRTFIVKIEDGSPDSNGNHRSSTPNISHQSNNKSYGASFALTRSPTTEIEIRQGEPRILVSHRKKQFENGRNENTPPPASNLSRYKTEIEKYTTFRKFDSVAARLATFERQNSTEQVQVVRSRSQTPVSQQPVSKVRRMSQERVTSPEPSQNSSVTQGNSQSQYQDSSAPIRIYVSQGNSNTSASPIVEIVPVRGDYDKQQEARVRDAGRSGEEVFSPGQTEGDGHGQKPVRKASFLSAVNAPHSRYLPQTGYDHETPAPDASTPKSSWLGRSASQSTPKSSWAEHTVSPANSSASLHASYPPQISAISPPGVSIATTAISTTPIRDVTTTVRYRNKPEMSAEDLETKLHRRTSYLMATAKDRSVVSLTMSPNSVSGDPQTPATMTKHMSMRKLKSFFGEKTPKIVEATEKRLEPASPIQTVIKEGNLGCKIDVVDGKRASDRSWRPVWAVLRGHALSLYKEKRDPGNFVTHALSIRVKIGNQTSIFSYDEQPISIKSCIVDIAHSYTKKKNVFRLKTYNGSEYLFQAEDHEAMITWINAIKSHNDPDEDAQGVTNAELIIRKSQEIETTAVTTKTSPPASQKMSKKLSVLSMKPKIPHSPNLKRRKTSTDKGSEDTGKPKTWKGKIGKSFKKQFGTSPSAVIQTVPENTGMFGVPLECCTPSPNNEYVPLLVDLCTQIVEAKGLEMTGVYRIPGNKAAVTALQEEFNKGIDSMNLDHEKWADVNVISSLLKSFFRQLPETLITDELYQPLIDASRIEDQERRMLKLKRLIHELPEHHFETFKHLAKHLNKVALYGDVNRMEAKNLAIVFGPTLIRKTDDNMISMFTDMSDHCKIIESIILHCDWFFGSWDMDNYVPTDDDATECTSIVSSSTRDDPDNISINPREIVFSIVEAANRKLKGESEEKDVPVMEPKFQERNIDQEILLRTHRMEKATRSSPNLTVMQRSSEVLSKPPDIIENIRMAKSQEFCDREFSDIDFIDSEKENQSGFVSTYGRHLSDDSLIDKNDELEFSHGSHSGNYRLSRETLDSLRRIEMEARALREREEKRQRDHEKRKLEKQRIEQDILRTQQELEIEDRHSVEDLLNAPDYSSGYYSRDPSNHEPSKDSPYLSNHSVYSNNKQSSGGRYCDSPSGGKFFVSIGNSRPGGYDRSSRPPRQTSVESLATSSKRTGSLENMADGRRHGHGRPLAQVRGARKRDNEKSSRREYSEGNRRSNGVLGRSNSVRRGSLDSLIDLIEKRDNRMSWASTDSEDGLDLLTTLTSTFDQKLQTFSSPKLTQSGPPPVPRRLPNTASSPNVTNVPTDSGDPVSQNAQNRLPPQVPLMQVSRGGMGTSSDSNKQYRDPSLHRTPPKPEAKIGFATRFERSALHNPMYQGHSEGNLSSRGFSYSSDLTYPSEVPTVQESRVSSVMVVTPSPSIMSADSSRQSTGHMMSHITSTSPNKWDANSSAPPTPARWEPSLTPSPFRTDYRPITKSEKTEVNVKLSQVGDKNRGGAKSVGFSSGIDGQRVSNVMKSRSESPEPSQKKNNEKRKKRRHTVGGTNDTEHLKAISEANPRGGSRISAWEQLQPAVSDNSRLGPNSSMLSWLQNERLRGSSPDLTSVRSGDKQPTKRN